MSSGQAVASPPLHPGDPPGPVHLLATPEVVRGQGPHLCGSGCNRDPKARTLQDLSVWMSCASRGSGPWAFLVPGSSAGVLPPQPPAPLCSCFSGSLPTLPPATTLRRPETQAGQPSTAVGQSNSSCSTEASVTENILLSYLLTIKIQKQVLPVLQAP